MAAKPTTAPAPARILRCRQVLERVGISKSVMYARMKFNPKRPQDFDATFPRPISLGPKAVGWIESEVEAWIASRAKKARHFTDDGSAR